MGRKNQNKVGVGITIDRVNKEFIDNKVTPNSTYINSLITQARHEEERKDKWVFSHVKGDWVKWEEA